MRTTRRKFRDARRSMNQRAFAEHETAYHHLCLGPAATQPANRIRDQRGSSGNRHPAEAD
jgi:hypothetical protein